MPIGIWSVEFANLNAQRRYPLADDASGTDTTGSFTIPDNFLVGLDLPVDAGADVDPARFFLWQLGAYATGYSLVVGYQPVVGDPLAVASALIPRQAFARNGSYRLGGGTNFEDSAGKVVIGTLADIDLQPAGFWTFSLETTRLDPDAVRPMLRGVTAIVCVNGTQKSPPITGIIELVANSNMRIDPVLAVGQDPIIRFSAIAGEGTIDDCVCIGDSALNTPITSIQGIAPQADGSFFLIGSTCIEITPIANGLKLIDTCAAPCCGCQELETITQDLERLSSQFRAVETRADLLQKSVETMRDVVLSSKTGAAGCATCE